MRIARSPLVSAMLAVLTVAGLASAGTSAAAVTGRRAVTPLDWHACAGAASFQCATMKAPLDYDSPRGAQIGIAVIRHLATEPTHRAGSLFWNPGGPGAAATANLPAVYPLFASALRTRFDIVGLDPRGIGGSAQLQCFATPQEEDALLGQLPPGGFPVGAAQVRTQIKINQRLDRACAEHGGPIQYHMSTANDARDIDRARQALGEAKVNYYGISYGTYLGVTFANLFPSHLGRIVLDGNVPPVQWNGAPHAQRRGTFLRLGSPAGTEIALQTMLDQCGQVSATRCAFSAGTPAATRAKYRALLTRVRARPVTVAGQAYTYALTVATVSSSLATQNANGITPGWKTLASLMQSLWVGSARATVPARPAAAAADASGPAAPSADAFAAQVPEGLDGVVCGESPNPRDPHSYVRQARIANAGSRTGFGDIWSWLAEPCAGWQARDADRYTGPWNHFTKPYLLVGTVADPETAYAATLKMARELPDARVLTETGGGHTALLNKSSCIDDHIAAYFLTGARPRAGTVCAQNHRPF